MIEIRDFAERVLLSDDLEVKLQPAGSGWADDAPGKAVRVVVPARPPNLHFAARRTAPAMPHPQAFRDPAKRAVAHHIMANHELQALEVMAWVLCAFPEAPRAFRRGMVDVMADEQRHTRMHIRRARELGCEFGSLPVNGYIWRKAQEYTCPLDYIAGLPLTFEGRNLDHTMELAAAFAAAGDDKSAAVMRSIHDDEINHVAFGWEWLRRLKPPEQSEWDAYCAHLHWPLRPSKSKGERFDEESRRAAGMSAEFIEQLERARDEAESPEDGGAG